MNVNEETINRFSKINTLFADIDDTISTDGKITSEAYDVLWEACEAGFFIVPVTGRPAGWCDHIARMWPVAAVIGENGGLYFRMTTDGMKKVFMHDDKTRLEFRGKLEDIRQEILTAVPECAVSSDQLYREYDLAVDYCEDVPRMPRERVAKIVSIFEKHGAIAKVSSVHVNGWFGDFNKLKMVKRFASEVYGVDIEKKTDEYAFIGDSPNDEPMFEYFPLSFGVKNVSRFLDDMTYHPAYIADGSGGAGFVEVVKAILHARKEMG